jgi:hypothetical protein
MGRPLGGVWCARRGSDESLGLTASSPRGFGSSRGNCLFFFDFGLEISEERFGEDVGERLQELRVDRDGASPCGEVTGRMSGL